MTEGVAGDEGWFRYTGADTVYVFVHGVNSNPKSCWQGKKAYWPEIVATDSRLGEPNVFVAQYHTGALSGDYDVNQCALEVFQSLIVPTSGHPPVIECSTIIFVSHSMGGIVVRDLIESNFLRLREKKIGLVLMASPSMGSRFANLASGFAAIFGNKQVRNLRVGDATLRGIDERFRRLLHENRIPFLKGAEAVEHNGYVRLPLLRLLTKPIVAEGSASRYFGPPQRLPGTNHSSIVKPASKEARQHQFLVAFVLDNFGAAETASLPQLPSSPALDRAPVLGEILFDSLNERSLPYYLARDQDQELGAVLKYYSVWVVGPSGVGKTSAARAQMLCGSSKFLEICLSAYASNFTVQNCLEELAFVIETRQGLRLGTIDRTEQSIFYELAELAGSEPLILYFDEVPPAGDDVGLAFSEFVVRLLNQMKDQYHNPNFRVLLSSIVGPNDQALSNGKAKERIRTMSLALWSNDSLGDLLSLLKSGLATLDPALQFCPKESIVTDANGLPRELKNFLRESLLSLDTAGQGVADQMSAGAEKTA